MAVKLTGCVLSFPQLLKLLVGLSYEKKCDFVPRKEAAKLYRSSRFRKEYYDILTSLVLFGSARIPLTNGLWLPIEAGALEREGLLHADSVDGIEDLQGKMVNTYRVMHDKCRALESNPATSPLKYIDDPMVWDPSTADRIDAQCEMDDIVFYSNDLRERVAPLMTGIHDIFGHYFTELVNENLTLYDAAAERFISHLASDDIFRTVWNPQINTDKDILDFDLLFRDMGICIRDGLALDDWTGQHLIPGYYTPKDLAGISEMNGRLFGDYLEFDESVTAHISFGIRRDPLRFLQIHTFWQTFFEVISMMKLSEASDAALFIPSAAKIRTQDGRTVTTDTSPGTSAELVRVYRIYLTESGMLPTPTTFEDTLRLRDDKNLNKLRNSLARWSSSYPEIAQEPDLMTDIRKEIAAAKKTVERMEKYARVASIVGYVALPVSVAEAATGRSLGSLALAPIGPAIDTYRLLRLRKFGWVNFGKL